MSELFTPQSEQILTDYFGQYKKYDKFWWTVAIFTGNGASEVIKHAINEHLEIFYPFRLNNNGNFSPLWKNYLFIEWIQYLTPKICRRSTKFIKFITFDGQQALVDRHAIDECLRLLKMGEYNFSIAARPSYPAGSIFQINSDDNFNGKSVKLLVDLNGDVKENKKVPVECGRWKMWVEVKKLNAMI